MSEYLHLMGRKRPGHKPHVLNFWEPVILLCFVGSSVFICNMNASQIKAVCLWAMLGAALGALAGCGLVYYCRRSRYKKDRDEHEETVEREKEIDWHPAPIEYQRSEQDEALGQRQLCVPQTPQERLLQEPVAGPSEYAQQNKISQKLDFALNSLEELKVKVASARDALSAFERRRTSRMTLVSQKKKMGTDYRTKRKELTRSTYLYLVASARDNYGAATGGENEVSKEKQSSGRKDTPEDPPGPDEGFPLTEAEKDEMWLLLLEMDRMHIGTAEEQKKALEIILKYKARFSGRPEYCWRLLRAYGDMIQMSDENMRQKYVMEGKEEGAVAVMLFENNARCQQWFAVMCGYMTEFDDKENSLKDELLFMEHIGKAIALAPKDHVLYSLLGRWMYGRFLQLLCDSGTIVASDETMLSNMIEDALRNLLKAEHLQPGHSKSNRFYTAKCCWILGRTGEAFNWLDTAMSMPVITDEDENTQEELKELLTNMKRVLT